MQPNLATLPKADFHDFNLVKAEDISSVIDDLLQKHDELLQKVLQDKSEPKWSNFMEPLDELEDYFEQIWSAI